MNIIRLLVVLSLVWLFACDSNLDSSKLSPNNQFVMADNLMCTIKDSSNKKEIGKKIALIGLNTTQPKAKFESGVTSALQKVFESESTLTVLLVASGSGSIDAFVIDKKRVISHAQRPGLLQEFILRHPSVYANKLSK